MLLHKIRRIDLQWLNIIEELILLMQEIPWQHNQRMQDLGLRELMNIRA